jgi:hypothetical protein
VGRDLKDAAIAARAPPASAPSPTSSATPAARESPTAFAPAPCSPAAPSSSPSGTRDGRCPRTAKKSPPAAAPASAGDASAPGRRKANESRPVIGVTPGVTRPRPEPGGGAPPPLPYCSPYASPDRTPPHPLFRVSAVGGQVRQVRHGTAYAGAAREQRLRRRAEGRARTTTGGSLAMGPVLDLGSQIYLVPGRARGAGRRERRARGAGRRRRAHHQARRGRRCRGAQG